MPLNLRTSLTLDTQNFTAGVNRARKSSNSMNRFFKKNKHSIDGVAHSLQAATLGLSALRRVASAVKAPLLNTINTADMLGKTAQKFALTSEELSKLRYSAELSGVSAGKLESAIGAMVRRTNNFKRDGSGAAAKAMKEMGLSVEFANKHFTSTDETFKVLLDNLSKMPEGIRKTAVAQDLFSKAAADVIRMSDGGAKSLNKMGEEAKRLGIVISDDFAKRAAHVNDEFTRLNSAFDGVKNSLVEGFLPPLTKVLETINSIDTKNIQKMTSAIMFLSKHALILGSSLVLSKAVVGGYKLAIALLFNMRVAMSATKVTAGGLRVRLFSLGTVLRGIRMSLRTLVVPAIIFAASELLFSFLGKSSEKADKLSQALKRSKDEIKTLSKEQLRADKQILQSRLTELTTRKHWFDRGSTKIDPNSLTGKEAREFLALQRAIKEANKALEKFKENANDTKNNFFDATKDNAYFRGIVEPYQVALEKINSDFQKRYDNFVKHGEDTTLLIEAWTEKIKELDQRYKPSTKPQEDFTKKLTDIKKEQQSLLLDHYKRIGNMEKVREIELSNYTDTVNKAFGASSDRAKELIGDYKDLQAQTAKLAKDNKLLKYYEIVGNSNEVWRIREKQIREEFKSVLKVSQIQEVVNKQRKQALEEETKKQIEFQNLKIENLKEAGEYEKAWGIKKLQILEELKDKEIDIVNKTIAIRKAKWKEEIREKRRSFNRAYVIANGTFREGMRHFQEYESRVLSLGEQGIKMGRTIESSLQNNFNDFFEKQSKNFLDFGKLGKNVLKDIANQMLKMQVIDPLAKAGGKVVNSVVSSVVSSVGSYLVSSLFYDGGHVKRGYADGGYTANVGVKEIAGVVHGGEYVVPAWQVKKNQTLIQAFEAQRVGKKGFWRGGFSRESLNASVGLGRDGRRSSSWGGNSWDRRGIRDRRDRERWNREREKRRERDRRIREHKSSYQKALEDMIRHGHHLRQARMLAHMRAGNTGSPGDDRKAIENIRKERQRSFNNAMGKINEALKRDFDVIKQYRKKVNIRELFASVEPKSYANMKEIEELNAQIKANRPLVSFAKSVEASVDSILIGNYAKMLSDTEGVTIGQNRLFDWLRANGYLITGGARHNVPYQKYIDNGYFEVTSQTYAGATGTHQKFTTKITGKGQIALAQKIVNAFKKVA